MEAEHVTGDLLTLQPMAVPGDSSRTPSKEGNPMRQRPARLPLARVKTMMKRDPECGMVAQDAVFLITKATEMFIEYIGLESYKQIGKRKTVLKRDVDNAIEGIPQLCFLDGALE